MDNLINSPIDQELSKLSPFELKGRIIAMADEKVKKPPTPCSMPAVATLTGLHPLPAMPSSHSASSPCRRPAAR